MYVIGGLVSKNKNLGMMTSLLVMGFTFVAFQNCSRASFKVADENLGVLKAVSVDSSSASDTSPGDDGNVTSSVPDVAPTPVPDVAPTPVPDVASTPAPQYPGKNPQQGEEDSSSLIECELGHPNKKVIYGESFAPGSNASATRACMSEDSCLKVINAYAAVRGCELNPGPATSEASPNSQCTKIFPGSKGTCHNAKILSDDDVVKILENMGQ